MSKAWFPCLARSAETRFGDSPRLMQVILVVEMARLCKAWKTMKLFPTLRTVTCILRFEA
jgi:hypothetical protein